jgi:hypothetical protein
MNRRGDKQIVQYQKESMFSTCCTVQDGPTELRTWRRPAKTPEERMDYEAWLKYRRDQLDNAMAVDCCFKEARTQSGRFAEWQDVCKLRPPVSFKRLRKTAGFFKSKTRSHQPQART